MGKNEALSIRYDGREQVNPSFMEGRTVCDALPHGPVQSGLRMSTLPRKATCLLPTNSPDRAVPRSTVAPLQASFDGLVRLAELPSYPCVNHEASLYNEGPLFGMQNPSQIAEATAIPTLNHEPKNRELTRDHEAETKTISLTTEIIRCIAKSLLASAEELERSLWHYSTPTEHSQSSTECDDDALKL